MPGQMPPPGRLPLSIHYIHRAGTLSRAAARGGRLRHPPPQEQSPPAPLRPGHAAGAVGEPPCFNRYPHFFRPLPGHADSGNGRYGVDTAGHLLQPGRFFAAGLTEHMQHRAGAGGVHPPPRLNMQQAVTCAMAQGRGLPFFGLPTLLGRPKGALVLLFMVLCSA